MLSSEQHRWLSKVAVIVGATTAIAIVAWLPMILDLTRFALMYGNLLGLVSAVVQHSVIVTMYLQQTYITNQETRKTCIELCILSQRYTRFW